MILLTPGEKIGVIEGHFEKDQYGADRNPTV